MTFHDRTILLHSIRDFIINCDPDKLANGSTHNEDTFNALALDLFHYQFEYNSHYKKLCQNRHIAPESIQRWQDIPPVMTTSFKYAPLFCGDSEKDAVRVFHTSGTTQNVPGKHYFRSLDLYQTAAMRMFKWSCLPDFDMMPILILGPTAELFPHSSLGQMFSWIVEAYGAADNKLCLTPEGLAYQEATQWLQAHCEQKTPVLILATSLALLDFIENGFAGNTPCTLFTGSRIIDTGGYKSSKHSISRKDFLEIVSGHFGLAEEWLFNEYGMTEMSSQFYETRFLAKIFGVNVKVAPPWVRSMACDPDALIPLSDGKKGVLRHIDLANLDSVAMLQTEDVGIVRGRTIELLGRDPDAELRGCSLLAEEILRTG